MEQSALTHAQNHCRRLAEDLQAKISELESMDGADFDDRLGVIDRSLGTYYERTEACRRFAGLHRHAVVDPFYFGDAFHQWNPSADGVVLGFVGEDNLPLVGDSDQLFVCLDLLTRRAGEGRARDFEMRVHAQSDPPNVWIRDPDHHGSEAGFSFGHGLDVDRHALSARWAAATRGGAIHERDGGELVLELRGAETWDEGFEALIGAEKSLQRAARTMRPWRNVIGTTESGYSHAGEGTSIYVAVLGRALIQINEALAHIEGETSY